jgi:hypothetical protein
MAKCKPSPPNAELQSLEMLVWSLNATEELEGPPNNNGQVTCRSNFDCLIIASCATASADTPLEKQTTSRHFVRRKPRRRSLAFHPWECRESASYICCNGCVYAIYVVFHGAHRLIRSRCNKSACRSSPLSLRYIFPNSHLPTTLSQTEVRLLEWLCQPCYWHYCLWLQLKSVALGHPPRRTQMSFTPTQHTSRLERHHTKLLLQNIHHPGAKDSVTGEKHMPKPRPSSQA